MSGDSAPEDAVSGGRAAGTPTALTTAATASVTETCSHSRTTVQPASVRASSAARSRSTFRCSLGDQYHSLFFGLVPCSGQACQKQPSTNTATLRLVKAISGRTQRAGRSRRKSLRYRYPIACSARRRAISGLVSVRRFPCMFRDRPGVSGYGYGFLGRAAGSGSVAASGSISGCCGLSAMPAKRSDWQRVADGEWAGRWLTRRPGRP